MQKATQGWIRASLCLMLALATPLAAFAAGQGAAAADPTAVLKLIPADAVAFLAIPSLKGLDTSVLGVAKKLGLPLGPEGAFPGPLDFAKENAGISEGLNDNGCLALAVLNCSELESVGMVPTRLAILIPCTDAEALIKSMQGEKDGDTFNVMLAGMPSVAAAKDGFLVLGQTPEIVQEVLRAKGGGIIKSMSPDRVQALSKHGIVAWANFRGISKQIREEIINGFKGLMLMGNPAGGAQVESSVQQINTFIDETQELSLGLSLDDKAGLIINFYYRVKPGGEFGKQMAAVKPAEGSMLIGLPDEPTVLAIGAVGPSGIPGYEKQMHQMLDQFLTADTVGDAVKPEELKTLKESIVKLVVNTESMSVGVSGLPVGGEDGLIGVTLVAKVADSAQWQGSVHETFDMVKGILLRVGQKEGALSEEDSKALEQAVQWKANAEQVEGAAVDHFVVDLAKVPDASEEDIAEIKGVIGQEGVLIRVAAVGKNHAVLTFGGGQKRFAKIAGLVKNGQAPLSENKNIKLVSSRLPTGNRVREGYFSVDRLFAMVMDIANQVGQPIPFPLAMRETAPIAITSIKVDDTAQQTDILVPIELAMSVKEMLGPFIDMMLMGGGGGQKSGPAPAPQQESGLQ